MDYTIDHALNHAIREHPLLVAIIAGFANWGVLAFGVAACASGCSIRRDNRDLASRAARRTLRGGAWAARQSGDLAHLWIARGPIRIIRSASFRSHAIARSLVSERPRDGRLRDRIRILFVMRRTGWLFLAWAV